jgi:hypothetical protein
MMGLREETEIKDIDMDISNKYDPKVIEIQKELINKGYYIGKFGDSKDGIDGIYGPITKAAHESYKKEIPPEEFESKKTEMAKEYVDEVDVSDLKEFKFHKIPGGTNNWRSAQITADVLPLVIKKYGIKNIVRMNGDDSDSRHKGSHSKTSRDTEKKICEENDCTYHFINAHSGFKLGKGYTSSIQQTSNILNQGNTLIHCAHGADRTGGMVGSYLKNNGYMTDKDELWKYTTQFNNWQDKINRGNFFDTGYAKYADGFYPISELKNSKWVK